MKRSSNLIIVIVLVIILVGIGAWYLTSKKETKDVGVTTEEFNEVSGTFDIQKLGAPVKAESMSDLEGFIQIEESGFKVDYITVGYGGVVRFQNTTSKPVIVISENKNIFDTLPLGPGYSYDINIPTAGMYGFRLEGSDSKLEVQAVQKIEVTPEPTNIEEENE